MMVQGLIGRSLPANNNDRKKSDIEVPGVACRQVV